VLRLLIAHAGPPPTPEDLWSAWTPDPVVSLTLLVMGWTYWRGSTALHRSRPHRWRTWSFALGLLALGLALLSPLDALGTALASAHMAQHLLLMVVAAPLIAASRPLNTLRRGVTGLDLVERWWLRTGGRARVRGILRLPLSAWILHTATLWFWHASVPYQAALRTETVHILQHSTFFLTALLFWSTLIRVRRAQEVGWGIGVLLIFALATQGTILAALMAFGRTPWYGAYTETTVLWGVEPLADQHLAAVIMWIPAGMIYLGAALALMSSWMREAALDRVGNAAAGTKPHERGPSRPE
jgi:putative membrane protein